MKRILVLFLLINLFLQISSQSQSAFFTDSDIFFKKFVVNGTVNYNLIKKDNNDIRILIDQISNFPLTDEVGDRNKAFYINAYNLLVISQLVESYPVGSPQGIPGFFDHVKFNVAGSEITLNDIENNILRQTYSDPRIHFVLVCGAMGCPPITKFSYQPDLLESQLENQTKKALTNPDFIKIRNEDVLVSEIFKWFESDFISDNSNVIDYINQYRSEKLQNYSTLKFYDYDWSINDYKSESVALNPELVPTSSNIFSFTPSSLLKLHQVEMQLFNNLYTQTAYRDENRNKVELDSRDTYYSALFYALYGISKSAKVNIGFDFNLKSVLIDTTIGSPFKVFQFNNTSQSRTAITSIGPKIKFSPFNKFSGFSIQTAFWIPIAKDLESIEEFSDYPWMDYNMYTWWNQFFYDKTFGSQWQVFTEIDLLFRFKTKNSNTPTHLDVPISAFVSWFPFKKFTLYYQIQYSPRFQLEKTYVENGSDQQSESIDPFTYISDYSHTGLGLKYQLTRNLNLEASSTYFFTSKNGGAGYTLNLGIRIII